MGDADIVQKSNYTFRLDAAPYAGAPPTCNGLGAGLTGQGYAVAADPIGAGNPRFFGTNSNAQLCEHNADALERHAGSGRAAHRRRAPLISYNSQQCGPR